MVRLTIFVPGLFIDLLEHQRQQIAGRACPALAVLLARAHKQALQSTSIERNLLTLCGVEPLGDSVLPVAAITALVDYAVPRPDGIMRADPVHLRADPNQILLFNEPDILPSAQEADSLLEILNNGLPDLALSRGRHPGRWYFCSKGTLRGSTSSPNAANGRSIAGFLPQGAWAREFAKLMNEAQMLMHSAPANVNREENGIPAINSIWPWGGGSVAPLIEAAPDFVVGDDVLLRGIAERFNLDWRCDMQPGEVIAELARNKGHALVVLGSPNGRIEAANVAVTIDDFEQVWATPLLNSLRRFRLNKLQLITDRDAYSLNCWNIHKLWRRPQSRAADGHE